MEDDKDKTETSPSLEKACYETEEENKAIPISLERNEQAPLPPGFESVTASVS